MIFTYASAGGYAMVISQEVIERQPVESASAQVAEVQALILALQLFKDESLNSYTDSVYASQILKPLKLPLM